MTKLHSDDAWDQDAELDCVDHKEVDGIVPDGDADNHSLPEDLEDYGEWFDGSVDEEFMDDDSITEEEAMVLARRFGGDW